MANDDYLPARYDWPAAVKGDTFPGITNIAVSGQSTTLSSVRCHFRTAPGATGSPTINLTSAGGQITINDNSSWNVTVNPFVINAAAALYYYDMEFTDTAGGVRTWLHGNWPIRQDTSR